MKRNSEIDIIREAGTFDENYYRAQWKLRGVFDIADPIEHYLAHGAISGVDPELHFDVKGYLNYNPELFDTHEDPYINYLLEGKAAGKVGYQNTFICDELKEMVVTSDGTVTTCSVDIKLKNAFGNIYNESFSELREKFVNLRHKIFRDPSSLPACNQCHLSCSTQKHIHGLITYLHKNPSENQVNNFYTRSLDALSSIRLEPISVCNAECSSCFITQENFNNFRTYDRLDFSKVIKSIDFEKEDKEIKRYFLYYYGEPFMHKYLMDFIEYLAKNSKGAKIIISTNGTYLEKSDITRRIVETSNTLDILLFVSLHGSNDKNVSYYMGENVSVKKVNDSINKIYQYRQLNKNSKISVVWRYVLLEWNDKHEEVYEAIRLAYDSGYDKLQFILTKKPAPSKRFTRGSEDWDMLARENFLCDANLPGRMKKTNEHLIEWIAPKNRKNKSDAQIIAKSI